MSWEVSVRKLGAGQQERFGSATFQSEWGSLFYGTEVYDQTKNNCVATNGTFIVDVAFKPRWDVLLERLEPLAELDPTGEGKLLCRLIREVLATKKTDDYVICIG